MTDYSLADIARIWAEYEQESRFVAISRRGSVACIICGAQGPGILGTPREVDAHHRRNNSHHWQRLHCKPHEWECLCGMFFPSSQSLSSHCSALFRHGVEGHGRLDLQPLTIPHVVFRGQYKPFLFKVASKTYFELWG